MLKNPATTGALRIQGGDGAINILTRRDGLGKDFNGQATTRVMGYSVTREFYSPAYSIGSPSPALPDRRATLYWNPSVQTNANGQATLKYYSSSETTTIHINVQGVDKHGSPGLGQHYYQQ